MLITEMKLMIRLTTACATAVGLACATGAAEALTIGRQINMTDLAIDNAGELASVDLAMAPGASGESDDLYFVYGATDGGETLDNWANKVKVATFDPATNTFYRATNLPAGFGRSYSAFRFALVSKTLWARHYRRQDALVAHYDAIENKAPGVHDAGITTWNDLKGSYNATRTGTPSVGDKGISFVHNTGNYYSVPDVGRFHAEMGATWTVEAVVTPGSGWNANYSGICGCHNTGGRGVTMGQVEGGTAAFFTSAVSGGGTPGLGVKLSAACYDKLWTFSYLDSPTDYALWTNGVVVASRVNASTEYSTLSSSAFYLGRGFGGNNRNFSGKIHAIRIYKCNLTSEEIAFNRWLDEARFGSEVPDVDVLSFSADGGSQWFQVTVDDIPPQPMTGGGPCRPAVVARGVRMGTVSEIPVTDYEVAYADNDKVGLATATVTVPGNDPIVKTFVIGEAGIPEEETFPARTSADYENGALFANFDAIDNAGAGQHSATTRTWVNLKDTAHNATYQLATAPSWNATGVTLEWNSSQFFSVAGSFMPEFGTRWTIQALVTPGSQWNKNYSGICGNHGNGVNGISFGQCQDAKSSFSTYNAGTQKGASAGASIDVAPLLGQPHLFTFVVSTGDRRLYVDEELTRSATTAVDETLIRVNHDPFYIGRANNNNARNFSGVVHAIRVYTNLLTSAEVARSRAIDAERFLGARTKRLTIADARKSGTLLQFTLRRPESCCDASVECLQGALYHGADRICWMADGGVGTYPVAFRDGDEEIVVMMSIAEGVRFLRFVVAGMWSPTLDLTTVEEGEISNKRPVDVDGSPMRSTCNGQPAYGRFSLATGEGARLEAPAGVVQLDGGGIGEVTGWVAYKGADHTTPWRSGTGNVCDDYVQPDEPVRFVWNWRYYSGVTVSSGGEVRVDGGAWTNLAACSDGEHQLEARPRDGYAFWRWTGETGGIADAYAASTTVTLDDANVMAVFVPTNTVRVPTGYRELEFVKATGNQRIDTGLVFDTDVRFRMRFDYAQSGGGCYFGTGSSARSSRFFAYNNGLYLDFPSSDTGYTRTILSGYIANTVYEVEVGDAYIQDLETGAKATSTKKSATFDAGTMRLFNSSADYGRVFYLRVWDVNGLAGDFVPAMRISDGAIGLWDNVTEHLFENVGTDTLIGGEPFNDGEHLTVTAEPQEHASTLVPVYGKSSGWYAGRKQDFSAEPLAGDDLRIAPTKWRVLTRADITSEYVQRTNGTGGAFTYVHDGHNTKVIWTWETQYRLTARAEGPGAVQFDDGDVGYCVTNWSVTGEGTVTLRAIPHADKHFLYWTGDLVGVSGSLYDDTLTCSLADARARTIVAVFSDDPFPPCHWTGAGDGKSFEDAENWAQERVPGEDDDVFVLSASTLAIQAKEAHVLKSLTVLGTMSSTVTLSFRSNLTVRTDVEVGTNSTLETTLATTVSNDVHIAAGAVATHTTAPTSLDDPDAVRERLDWTVLGDMTVDAGGKVDVSSKGLSSGKGAWIDYKSSHGGRYDNSSKGCYGSVLHPFAYGSGGHYSWDCRGGGVAKLRVAGTLTVNGSVLADGNNGGMYYSASGGSIDVTCGTLAGTGVIHAEGGGMTSGSSASCGGGGRVAVRQTVGRDFTTDWHGKVTAYGTVSLSGSGTPASGCGTVYLQSAADAEGGGRIVVDNAGGRGYTDFPMPEDGSAKRAYREATLELRSGTTLVLTNDVTVFDLDVRDAKAKIDLNGRTLTIRSKAHEGGAGWAAPTGTCVTVNGGKIVWKHPGMMLMVR